MATSMLPGQLSRAITAVFVPPFPTPGVTPRRAFSKPPIAARPRAPPFQSFRRSLPRPPPPPPPPPTNPAPEGRINCLGLGSYINNARLDYAVADLTTGVNSIVTTHPINTRYHFGGGFIGDYTGLAVGSDDKFHALWTDTNNDQQVVWWY